jgi:hypothetical protein
MHLLYYWKRENYVRDLDYGAGYHLNQSNPLMHKIAIGESLWAFTRDAQGRYVLAAELIARAKTHNPPNFRYGQYRVWADLSRSKYFETDNQPRVEHVIRQLSPKTQARYLGQSFQGNAAVREITQQDHQVLSRLSSDLKLEPRARILPEERLEAALLIGDQEAVYDLVHKEESGVAEERRQYLYQKAPTRNRALADRLQSIYAGQCQICCWNPRDDYSHNLCHAHHIHWLSRGGSDELENLMLVCPNHHEAIHRCDAHFDYRYGQYDFGMHHESISLNTHLSLWNS